MDQRDEKNPTDFKTRLSISKYFIPLFSFTIAGFVKISHFASWTKGIWTKTVLLEINTKPVLGYQLTRSGSLQIQR